jgi:hypothetical protein
MGFSTSARMHGRIRADAFVSAGTLFHPPRLPALDVAQRGHIKAWGWAHIKGENSFLPFPITNSKAWPYISHSCLPRLWLVEVGAINFASTVLPTCEEVGVTFML